MLAEHTGPHYARHARSERRVGAENGHSAGSTERVLSISAASRDSTVIGGGVAGPGSGLPSQTRGGSVESLK